MDETMNTEVEAVETLSAVELERRRQSQILGTADELRVLRTLNARANAMRRMTGNKNARYAQRLGKQRTGTRVA